MSSVWEKYIKTRESKAPKSGKYEKDIVVVGGGIAGIMCAYMLASNGHNVTLIEANKLFGGVTQNTTAHINALQAKYQDIPTTKKRRLYFRAQQEAVNGLADIVEKHKIDCDFERCDSFVFGTEKELKKEYKVLRKFDAPVEYHVGRDFPFGRFDAIGLANQARFNPIKFLQGLPKNFEIIENCRIKKVCILTKKLKTENHVFKFRRVIFATNFPIINIRGLYAFKMYKSFSYALNVESNKKLGGIFNSIAGDGITYRDHENGIIVGGLDHRTGRIRSCKHFETLQERAAAFGHKITDKWAANDCMTFDAVPYAGRFCHFIGRRRAYVISGFGKWGMTNSYTAAKIISNILGKQKNKYKRIYKPTRIYNVLVWHKIAINLFLDVGNLLAGLFSARKRKCPHMGCRLQFNKNTDTWDCPCHGSRFTTKGQIITGPAVDIADQIAKTG